MNKFKVGDRVVDITADPLEYGTIKFYTGGMPFTLWDNGADAGNICWTLEDDLELIERKEVTMGSKYKFVDASDVDSSVEVISESGSFETKSDGTVMIQDYVNTREYMQFLEERIEYFKRYLQKEKQLRDYETEMWKRSFWRFLSSPPKQSDDALVVSWRLREYREELLRVQYQGRNGGMIAPNDKKMLNIFYCWANDKTEYSERYLRKDV